LDDDCDGRRDEALDLDGDEFSHCEEFDDSCSEVNPEMVEICDGLDNNCNGEVDENLT